MRTGKFLGLILAAAAAAPAVADEVDFKNGDKLTGKIENMEGGKLTIVSTVAGKVTVDMKNVSTFSSAAPLALKLKDGSTIRGKVAAAPRDRLRWPPVV